MGEPGAGQGGTGQVRTGHVGTGQVCTSRFRTVQVRTGQVKTSQAGQVSTGQNGQVLLGTRVWPYSVLLVFLFVSCKNYEFCIAKNLSMALLSQALALLVIIFLIRGV